MLPAAEPNKRAPFVAALFDIDGVVLDSPHERAWREALQGIADPQRLTTALYQAHVAGRPRLAGARAVLEQLGVPEAAHQASLYAARKQERIMALIEAGQFHTFPDALRFVQAVRGLGIHTAAVSSSKNATPMMARTRLKPEGTLLDLFDANLCGLDVQRGKPDPEIYLLAAAALNAAPARCLVVEDAPAGIAAAKAGGMAGLGIARVGDVALLREAGADLVVTSLDHVDPGALARGELRTRSAVGN